MIIHKTIYYREELYTAQNYFATFNCLEQLFFFMEALYIYIYIYIYT